MVQNYLLHAVDTFGLRSKIRFGTKVEHVSPIRQDTNDGDAPARALPGSGTRWHIRSRKIHSDAAMEEEFDALAICNGHYSLPLWPSVAGLDKFKGMVLHSHSYRKPEPFRNRRVVVLGGGQSGRDISQELCRVAEVVVLSHRSAAVSGF